MGFFRDVGRRVERFKSEVEAVADEQASFACTACGARFHTTHDTCPECGADVVEPLAGAGSDDETPADEASGADSPGEDSTPTDPDRS